MLTLAVALESGGALANAPQANSRQAVHRAPSETLHAVRLRGGFDQPPPAPGGRRIRLRYMTQVKARPPSFMVSCSRPEDLPESYSRYLVNGLRDSFGLKGSPIRMSMRKGDNPYADKKKPRGHS